MTTKTLAKGHLSCLAKSFRYVPAASTDIRKTFEKIRAELLKADATVTRIRPKKGAGTA